MVLGQSHEVMMGFSYSTREKMLEELRESGIVDLLVIGGGITGAGIARDAALRGLKVCLLEKGDFASATSSRSSKLVHGGLRYLEHRQFGLVREALQERQLLMQRLAPHMVHPLPFLIPVWKDSPHSGRWIGLGLGVYDFLSAYLKPHRRVNRRQVARLVPQLNFANIQSAFLYYDCQTNDARLTLENVLSAYQAGAKTLNYVQVEQFLLRKGRIRGVVACDLLSDSHLEIQARAVVNATGPFADSVASLLKSHRASLLRPTKGVHIVLRPQVLSLPCAITYFSAVDRRVMFLIPWQNFTLCGTTDTDGEVEENGFASGEDVRYILDSFEGILGKNVSISPRDIVSAYAGWRSLIAHPSVKRESDVPRTHKIILHPEGLITVAGGKLTTYRRMAKSVVDFALKTFRLGGSRCWTHRQPLPGAMKFSRRAISTLSERDRHLLLTYGRRGELVKRYSCGEEGQEVLHPSLPYRWGDMEYFIQEELALKLQDIFLRRSHLFLQDPLFTLAIAERVATLLQKRLGWSEVVKRREIENYQKYVEDALKWKKAL